MGLYDRDYMREDRGKEAGRARGPSFLDRLRFRLWLIFRPRRKKGS